MRRTTAVWATAALAFAAAGPSVGVAAAASPPDRVQVLEARRMAHRVILQWRPAATGSQPTGYQVRLGKKAWRSTKATSYRVKGLRADRQYRVSIRAVRKGAAGAPVVIRLFPV